MPSLTIEPFTAASRRATASTTPTAVSKASLAAAGGRLSEVATAAAQGFANAVDVSRCAIFFRDETDDAFRVQTWRGREDYTAHLLGMVNGEDPYSAQILSSRGAVEIADSLSDPRVRQHLAISLRCDVRSMIGLPLAVGDDVLGLAFLDDEGLATRFSSDQVTRAVGYSQLCGVLLQQSRALHSSEAEILAWRSEALEHRRMLAATERFDALIKEGAPAAEFAIVAAALVGRPVEIVDSHWRIAAHAQPRRAPRHRVGVLADERIRSNVRVQPLLTRATHEGQACVLPPLPALGLDLRCVVAPITIGSITWGHVIVYESGRPFSPFDHRAAALAAGRIGCSSFAVGSRDLMRPPMDRDSLLREALGDVGSAEKSTSSVPGVSGPFVLCVLGGIGFSNAPRSALDLVQALSLQALAGAPISHTEHDGRLVVLVPTSDDSATVVERMRSVVERTAASTPALQQLTIGVSRPFADLSQCRHALHEAQQVLRAVRRFENPEIPRVVSAEELGASLTFLSSADVTEARHFGLAYIGPLVAEGAPPELLTTLRSFLHSGNVARCARALGVHENTVRYRLSKVQEMTGLNVLSDTDAQVRASLAVQVLRVSGACSW